MPFAYASGRMSYPIVQPTAGPAAPFCDDEPGSASAPAPSFLDAVQKAAQRCLLAGAACTGMPGTRQRSGFFQGVVEDYLDPLAAGSRDRFIVETMPSLKQLQRAEKIAAKDNVPLADTLHHLAREEHLKSTVASFIGRDEKQGRGGGVLRFLLLQGDEAKSGAAALAAAVDGPLVHKPLIAEKHEQKLVAGRSKAVADELRRTVPAGEKAPTVVARGSGAYDAAPHKSSALDWWESNVALIGSEEDRALRKRAAQTEPAWAGLGVSPGLFTFRVEQFTVQPYAAVGEGTLAEGDSYIFLHTTKAVDVEGEETDKLLHTIYFWLGRTTPIDAMGTAAYKTVELDDLLDGVATHKREVMGSESEAFQQLFQNKGGLRYVAGGVPSGFRRVCDVDLDNFVPRLLRITKVGRSSVIVEVPCTREALHQEAAFVLDLGRSLYVWSGSASSAYERGLARVSADQLEHARIGQNVSVMNLPDADFWDALGGEGHVADRARDAAAYTENTESAHVPLGHGSLFRLQPDAASGSLQLEGLVHDGMLSMHMLLESHVYLCDPGTELIVWMGKGSSERERRAAMLTATKYLALHGKPHTTPIKVFKSMDDAMKDESFAQIFAGA